MDEGNIVETRLQDDQLKLVNFFGATALLFFLQYITCLEVNLALNLYA